MPRSVPRWCMAAMLEPIAVGARFHRSAWPGHVTVAGNHVVGEPARLPRLLADAVRDEPPIDLRTGETRGFGLRADIPVLLVESAAIARVHDRLHARLATMPGFAADDASQWGPGFRPHVTLGPAVRTGAGDQVSTTLVLARLDEGLATIEALVALEAR